MHWQNGTVRQIVNLLVEPRDVSLYLWQRQSCLSDCQSALPKKYIYTCSVSKFMKKKNKWIKFLLLKKEMPLLMWSICIHNQDFDFGVFNWHHLKLWIMSLLLWIVQNYKCKHIHSLEKRGQKCTFAGFCQWIYQWSWQIVMCNKISQ